MKRSFLIVLVALLVLPTVILPLSSDVHEIPHIEDPKHLQKQPDRRSTIASGESWLSGWDYRQQHIINQSSGAGENYTVRIKVDSGGSSSNDDTAYLDGKMQSDFDDVRFTGSDGHTLLSYYMETQTDVTEKEYFYGEAKSSAFYVNSQPHAYYDLNNERTYVTFHGPNYDAYVMYYDHQNDEWSNAYKAGTNPIDEDWHGCPVLWVNTTGHVHVLHGSHETALQHRVTSNPNDITVWEDSTDIPASEDVTYPYVSYDPIDNVVHVWYRSTISAGSELDMHYTNSTDSGYTWNTYQKLVDVGAGKHVYPQSSKIDPVNREIMHITWRIWEPAESRETTLGYAYLNVTTGNLYNASGSNLGTSISGTEIEDCEFHDVPVGQRAFQQAVHIYGDNIYIIFQNKTNADANCSSVFTFWNGTSESWAPEEIIYATPAYYAPSPDFFVYDATNISAFLLVGKNVTEFKWDGSVWTLDTWIRNSTTREIRNAVCPTYWNNTHDEGLRVLYAEWENYVSDAKAWAWGTSGNLNRTYGGHASYWVRIPDTLSDSDRTIYVYYGNPDASSLSNGFGTFPEFFNNTSTSGWAKSNIEVTTSGDYLKFYNPTVADVGIAQRYDLSLPTDNFMFMVRLKGTSLGTVDTFSVLLLDGGTSDRFSQSQTPREQNQDQWWYYDGALKYGGDWTEDTEYIFEHHVNETDSTTGIDYYRRSLDRELLDSVTSENHALGTPSDLDGIYVGDGSGSANCEVYVYFFAWRIYIDEEPAHHTWGNEEEEPNWNINTLVEILFQVAWDPTFQFGYDAFFIFLGLIMIPVSTMYLVKGGRKEMTRDKLFIGLVIFVMGIGLLIGGIIP